MRSDIKYWIWLSSIPKVGARRSSQLIHYLGNPRNIWNASREELKNVPGLNHNIVELLLDKKFREEADKHLEDIYKHGIDVVTIEDETYPYYLKNVYDPPTVLYIKGKISDIDKTVAVVGSRHASDYGLNMAETIACSLSKCGVTVISGMARGIDTFAHNGALKAGGKTIAVLGCGLDIVYPVENKKLMEKIITSGAVVSEYLPGMPPVSQNFPARNRIISGLSLGVVVIEANEKSGSLITANFALEQGREVFALPGNVNSPNSKGTNKLIREGAKIVTEIQDILEELNIYKITNNSDNDLECMNRKKRPNYQGFDDDEIKIAESLLDGSLHIDILAERTALSMQQLNSVLVMLELKGIVEQEPGKIFKIR